MTTPNNTVAGLPEKWRGRADNIVASDEYNAGRKNTYEHCADQLEDALTPAPRTASVRAGFSAQGEPMYANIPVEAPSAPVVDDAMVERAAKAAWNLEPRGVEWEAATEWHEQYRFDSRTVLTAALSGVSAPVGDRVKVLEMFLGRIFAAQQLNESREYKGWKISGRGSLNEVVAEAREYLNCPLGAVDMQPPAPAAEHIVDANKKVEARGEMVLVPREPTEAMRRAWNGARPDDAVPTDDGGWEAPEVSWFAAKYRAMLAAALSANEVSRG